MPKFSRFLCLVFFVAKISWLFAIENSDRERDSITALTLQREGVAAGRLGDFELALENFSKVYQIREKLYGAASSRLAPPLINMGIQYKNLSYFAKAIEYYKKAESLCINDPNTDNFVLGNLYVNLGNIYSINGDYSQALEYQKNANRVLGKDSIKYKAAIQVCKYNIIEIQLRLGRNFEAIAAAKKNIASFSLELKSRLFDLIALAYKNGDQYSESEQNYLAAISSWKKLLGEVNIELISEYLAYSSLLLTEKRYDEAFLYTQKANEIALKFYSAKSTTHSDVQTSFGDYYFHRKSEAGQIDDFRKKRKQSLASSLEYYQKAIVALVDSFQNYNPLINPPIKNVISEIQLVDVIKKKALALEKLGEIYESEFDKTNTEKYYSVSLNTYSLAIDLIHKLQIGFESEDSKMFISQNQQHTFQEAIGVAYKLYHLTKDGKYALKAFEFSEKSKSSNLLASMKDVKAKEFGGIPDSLIGKEKELKGYISVYKSKLFEERHLEKPDTQKVNLYSSKIFKYNEEYSRLIDSFEKSYPRYYALKYEDKVIDLDQLQSKLNNRQALLEYFLKESADSTNKGELYIFAVTSDSLSFNKEVVDNDFLKKIQTFHDFLINPDYLNTKKTDYINYSDAAYGLYQKLVKPVERKIYGKSLTVIPHDKLSYIPFDALLSEMPDTSRMNFKDLKYLIRDYSISYAYSATLLFDSQISRNHGKKLLIFSPEYNSQEPRRDLETGNVYYLSSLSGAKKEMNAISRYVSSVSFVDKLAQETTFKKEAGNFDILHLAMHTIINDSLPMLSKLVFSKPETNSEEDGYLNAYEVYNMKFGARLAVLSACETGSGKLQGGEGVMSMARGFIYAGCPSVVMTLWQVEDKSGVNIMSDFYRYLSKGKRKDVALRMAKLNHLESSDPLTAHPHFWLGYVNIGNAEPLYTSKDVYFIIFIFVALLLLFADYKFRRNKK